MSVVALSERIRKLEDILKGHECRFHKSLRFEPAPSYLDWDGSRIYWTSHSGIRQELFKAVAGGMVQPDADVFGAATRLVSKCIIEHEQYEEEAADGVEVIDAYLSDAPWFKEETLDPIEAVMPRENT